MSNSTTNQNGNGTSHSHNAHTQPIAASPLMVPDSGALSQADRDKIMGLITQIRELLPFLQDLTAEERKTLLGMGDKNRVFAGKVLEVILQNPDFLPRSFDVEQYQQGLATFDRLATILMALTQLCNLVDATMTAIGTEVYEDALAAYRYAKASDQGASLEAMLADLKQRFAGQGKKKEEKKPEATE